MALSFFLRLLLGHVVGDFVLQPYWLVLAKRNGWPGLIIHVGVVTFITAILIWPVGLPNWWVWVIVLFFGHLFIDQFRTFVFTDNSKGRGLLLLILDQLAHVVLISLISWLATGWTFSDLILLTVAPTNEYLVLIYLIGLAIMIGVAPVFEAESAVAVLAMQGTEIKQTVAIDLGDRLLGGAERVVATFLILTGFGLLAPLAFVPRLGVMGFQGQIRLNRTTTITKVAISMTTALLVSYILYMVPAPVIRL